MKRKALAILIATVMATEIISTQAVSVYATTKSDKKMDSGVVKFILLKTVGNAYVDRTVTEEEMKTGFDLICGGNEGDRK